MYTEEYEHRGFPFKNFLFKLIFIIVFILLLIWLVPKFISPATVVNEDNSSNNNSSINSKNGNNSSNSANATTSQSFEENLNKMKEAALSYYTDDRLPTTVGQYKSMTLGEMIQEKIITPLKDKNNNNCDTEKSYIRITKLDDEYLLKVNLKDSEKEDYILVHLGNYNYCTNTICEKNTNDVPIKSGKSNNSTSIVAITPNGGTTKNNSGNNTKSSGNNTNNVAKNSSTSTSSSKSASSSKSSSSSSSNSKNSTSKSNSASSSSNIVSGSKESGSIENKGAYMYEYSKTTGGSLSSWTDWSNWSKTSCDTQELNCSDDDPSCLKKVQLYNRKEQIGTYNKKYTQQRETIKQTGSYELRVCQNYNYVIIDKTTYATTVTTTYNTINNISYANSSTCSSGSASLCNSWSEPVRGCYDNPPTRTATTFYIPIGADFSKCGETCHSLPTFCYNKYTLKGNITSSGVKVITPGKTTSNSTTEVTSSSEIQVTASCGGMTTKTVPIYSTITVNDIVERTEPLYGTVCYQSSKTRTVTNNGSIDTKWSTYDDKSLLDAGYTYTGNKRDK